MDFRHNTNQAVCGRIPCWRSKEATTLGKISAWAEKKNLDAVIWTALAGDFDAVSKEGFLRAAVKYVGELEPEGKAKATEYVCRGGVRAHTAQGSSTKGTVVRSGGACSRRLANLIALISLG